MKIQLRAMEGSVWLTQPEIAEGEKYAVSVVKESLATAAEDLDAVEKKGDYR